MNRKKRRRLEKQASSKTSDVNKYIYHELIFGGYENINKIVTWFENKPYIKEQFDKTIKHVQMKDFDRIKYTINNKQKIDNSFYMVYMLLKEYNSYIAEFVKLKNKYEIQYLSKNYAECLKILNDLEKKCGYSIWGISQKFKVIELKSGLSENKKMLSTLSSSCKKNIFVLTTIQFLSNRAEINISYSNYTTTIKKYFDSIGDEQLASYFYFKLIPDYINSINKQNIPIVFQIDMKNSIIDLYEDFIKLAQFINEDEISNYNLIELYTLINDQRLMNLSVYFNQYDEIQFETHLKKNEFFLMIIDFYTKGKYMECKKALEFYIDFFPENFQAKMLLAKVYIHLNLEPTSSDEILDLYNLYNFNEYYDESRLKLYKYLLTYSDTRWESKILYLIDRIENMNSKILKRYSFLNDEILTPGFSTILECLERNNFFEEMNKYAKGTTCLYDKKLFLKDYIDVKDNIEKNRFYIYQIKHFISKDLFDDTLFLLDKGYFNIDNNYYLEKINRYKLTCYEKKEQFNDYIELTVSTYMSNKNILERIPLNSISKKIVNTRDVNIKKNILTPVFAFISKNKMNIRKSFSNFIDYNQIENVDDLLAYNFETSAIKEFFLYNICTIDIMKRDYKFGDNVVEVYNSRLKILREIAHDNKNKLYLDEMMEISSKMKIKEHTNQINNNRIYVNVGGIKRENSLFLKEDFDKYIILRENDSELTGIDLNDEEYIKKFKQIYDETSIKSQQDANYKQNLLLLKSILERITDEFLFNSKYGLDTFLSARIRHGYCKDQLSKVFKAQNLLSKKNENSSDEYMVNEYWDDILNSYPEDVNKNIKKLLSEFTNRIELKIKEVKDEWIRIKTKSQDKGLFDYIKFVDVTSVIIDSENIVQDFDIFYDIVISHLWTWTDERLKEIRKIIKHELLEYFIESLSVLEGSIDVYSNEYHNLTSNLKNKITICKTDIAKLVTEFSNIFYKNDVEYNKFTINDAVVTCEQLFLELYPSFKKIHFVKRINCNYYFKGKYFPFFIDVFNILISNCVQHSEIDDFNNLFIDMLICEANIDEKNEVIESFKKININVDNSYTILKISIENNLNESINFNKIEESFQAVYNKIKNKETISFKKYTQTEGGTGLMKLSSILKDNMNAMHVIAYNIDRTNKKFLLEVNIVIRKGDNDSENIIC